MNSRHKSATRLFLILAFAYAISLATNGCQTNAPASTFGPNSQKGGRLIVQRAPNFGEDLIVRLSIDGRNVADIEWNRTYNGSVSGGNHVLSVLPVPNRASSPPMSTRLTVQPGQTYVFTAMWRSDRVVLRRSALAD
jgi:hypothetical protein